MTEIPDQVLESLVKDSSTTIRSMAVQYYTDHMDADHLYGMSLKEKNLDNLDFILESLANLDPLRAKDLAIRLLDSTDKNPIIYLALISIAAVDIDEALRQATRYDQNNSPAIYAARADLYAKKGSGTSDEIFKDERVIALYLFNEHTGNIVHNAVRPGVDLDIPRRYSILYQIRFEPFWKEYMPIRKHWMDFLLNVIGFVPLGFAFCAFWASTRPIKWALVLTTCLGFAVSLTIEFFQSYLPTRHSGTADLFTNTLGAFVGARLYASTDIRRSLESLNRILWHGEKKSG